MLKQRTLLKSIIEFKRDRTELKYILDNFNVINATILKFDVPEQEKIYEYVKQHAEKFVEVPSYNRLKKYFEEDADVLEELEKVSKEESLYDTNFKSLLEEVMEEQRQKELINLLKETSVISNEGKKISKNFKKGTKDAVQHFLLESGDFLKSNMRVKTQGSSKGDTSEAIKKYYDIKRNDKFDGLLTGLPSIDMVCKGIRAPELWLILAYVSELKTTVAMNFAYTQAIEQQKNVQFITLEMPYEQVRDLFICIHSANLNLWPGSKWDDVYPLNYDDIADGTLSEREEEFFNFLCQDMDNNPEYGNIEIYQPPDGLTMSHLRAWSEIEYRKKPFDIIYLDYIELMKSESTSREYTIDLNQRIKDLKQFAINFNEGKGIRVVSAYQANRKGKEHADKHDGEYRLDALSYANEAERSADVIIYSYLNDELRENNQSKMGCLKNRTRPKFKQFKPKNNLPCRKIYECPEEDEIENLTDSFQKNKNNKLKNDELIDAMV